MKEILIGIGTLNIGGTEKHVVDIIKSFNRKKFKISLFLLWQNGENLKLIPNDVEVYKVPDFLHRYSKLAVLYQSIRLLIILLRKNFIVVHYFLPHMYVIGGLISVLLKKKIIMSRRSLNNYQKKNKLFKIIEPFLHKKCTKIFVNSNSIKTQLIKEENVEKEKIELIYNGVKNLNFKKINKDHTTIICVANFIYYKRHLDILKAFSQLNSSNVRLKLVGNGNIEKIDQIESFAKHHNIIDRVDILVDQLKVIEIIGQSDIGLLASEEEGFSNAILEYMSCGLPVVASSVGGNREAIIHNKNGFLFEVGDTKKMAYYLEKLIKNKKLRTNMGKQSQLIQRNRYTIKKQIDSYEDIYTSILG